MDGHIPGKRRLQHTGYSLFSPITKLANALFPGHTTEKFLNEIPLDHSASVVEVGCGTGCLTRHLAAAVTRGKVVAIDSSEKSVRRAIKRCAPFQNVEFYVGTVDALPWEGNSFDYAACLDSFSSYPNPHTTLTEMLRVLKRGGRLFLGACRYRRLEEPRGSGRLPRKTLGALYSPEQYILCLEHSGFLDVWQKTEAAYLLTVGTKA
jgi:ubiquinone/menaquinone biosynthesis C-methylase UbiE